ncbi:DEAD/DEAH box helicase [Halosquirtibacter xylanolyticus]|uniref:DEAD/DEAH box helicase n=1 Tax=Halosquirtibacter xylanolyticus TaxID=3374599 RepID=UPI00374A09B3|nr:DEAD/DEAH box helicase [Prolixibacteraceae bacterium]
MKLKKLIPELVNNIIDLGYDKEPREVEGLAMSVIKSGADALIRSGEGTGKSTALVMGAIQRLKNPVEEAPRAIIVVSSREKAFEMEELFKKLSFRTNLRVFPAFDQGILQYQKDMIYEGLDLLIVTPKRLMELISCTGIPMTKIQTIFVDDFDKMDKATEVPVLYHLENMLEKVQHIVTYTNWHESLDIFEERVMKGPRMIEVEEPID